MKVLVIPDCHLNPWMFAQADTIMKKGIAEKAVCLMDLADDFGVHDDAQYLETYDAAIAFAKKYPETLWCYGNHDLSYIWGKPETGFHPEKRGLVCQEIKKLTNALPKKSQIAYIHKIDKTLFMHGGLANLFVQLRVAPQNRKNVLAVIKAINQMGCETMWAADSPIWYRPQLSPNQNAKRLYRGGKYLQVVGIRQSKKCIWKVECSPVILSRPIVTGLRTGRSLSVLWIPLPGNLRRSKLHKCC